MSTPKFNTTALLCVRNSLIIAYQATQEILVSKITFLWILIIYCSFIIMPALYYIDKAFKLAYDE